MKYSVAVSKSFSRSRTFSVDLELEISDSIAAEIGGELVAEAKLGAAILRIALTKYTDKLINIFSHLVDLAKREPYEGCGYSIFGSDGIGQEEWFGFQGYLAEVLSDLANFLDEETQEDYANTILKNYFGEWFK